MTSRLGFRAFYRHSFHSGSQPGSRFGREALILVLNGWVGGGRRRVLTLLFIFPCDFPSKVGLPPHSHTHALIRGHKEQAQTLLQR